jgi:hypothetical protein
MDRAFTTIKKQFPGPAAACYAKSTAHKCSSLAGAPAKIAAKIAEKSSPRIGDFDGNFCV